MTHAGYVLVGWTVTWTVLGGYAWRVLRKGRRLAPTVPAGERRWSSPVFSDRGGAKEVRALSVSDVSPGSADRERPGG